jgi:DNA-binding transcriptional MerR regulator
MAAEVSIPDRNDFKIGEVCEIAGVKPFVLRYWETEFPALAPVKGAGGQRSYSRADVELILRIKHLLYEERFTVAGAKKRLAEEQPEASTDVAESTTPPEARPARHKGQAARVEAVVAIDSAPPSEVERSRQALAEARRELQALIEKLA